jgi:hypothetical protein
MIDAYIINVLSQFGCEGVFHGDEPTSKAQITTAWLDETVDGKPRHVLTAGTMPSITALRDAWEATQLTAAVGVEIARLEQLVTPSRLADAALGDTAWLQANRDLIAAQRLLL